MVKNGQSKDSNNIEQTKAYIEYLKHLSTLSTGSIVLITAFLEKLFTKPIWKPAIIVSLISLMLSVLSSIIAYTMFAEYGFSEEKTELPLWASVLGSLGIIFTWAGFLVGILSLTIFAIKNLVQ